MKKSIVYQLGEEMKKRSIKTPKLAETLGIPKERIYKWFQEGTNPKEEDALKIRSWLNGEKEILTSEMPKGFKPTPEQALLQVLLRHYADYVAKKEGVDAETIVTEIKKTARTVIEASEGL